MREDDMKQHFSPRELQLDYIAFTSLVKARRHQLHPDVRAWLGAWELWDLACSPMADTERSRIRYGHNLGWFHSLDQRAGPPPTTREARALFAFLAAMADSKLDGGLMYDAMRWVMRSGEDELVAAMPPGGTDA